MLQMKSRCFVSVKLKDEKLFSESEFFIVRLIKDSTNKKKQIDEILTGQGFQTKK